MTVCPTTRTISLIQVKTGLANGTLYPGLGTLKTVRMRIGADLAVISLNKEPSIAAASIISIGSWLEMCLLIALGANIVSDTLRTADYIAADMSFPLKLGS